MTGLFALDTLVDRLRLYAERRAGRLEAWLLLERVLSRATCRAATQPATPVSGNAALAILWRRSSLTACLAPTRRKARSRRAFRCMRSSCCSPACSRRHSDETVRCAKHDAGNRTLLNASDVIAAYVSATRSLEALPSSTETTCHPDIKVLLSTVLRRPSKTRGVCRPLVRVADRVEHRERVG
jgi:hypothetical protein